jgi:hypothetical protein
MLARQSAFGAKLDRHLYEYLRAARLLCSTNPRNLCLPRGFSLYAAIGVSCRTVE